MGLEKLALEKLAKKIAPYIARRLMLTPSFYGDINRIKLAPNIGLNNTLFNTSSGDITVEYDVCFGHNVCLLTGTHDVRKKGRKRISTYPPNGRDIVIHGGVWLSSNVTVLGPCKIGENAVIAAGSMVLNDVKPNSLYAGSPAKFIKEIEFDDE